MPWIPRTNITSKFTHVITYVKIEKNRITLLDKMK